MRKPDNLSICKERMEQMEQKKRFPSLRGRITADAAVIGGGLSGITISLWLAKAGLKVAVAEAFRVGSGATGFCTGVVSLAKGGIYAALEEEQGITVTDAYAQTQKAAFHTIRKMNLKGKFEWKGFPFSLIEEDPSKYSKLLAESEAMKRAGLASTSFANENSVEWAEAALLNPELYLNYLTEEAVRHGVWIRENSRVTAVDADTLYTDFGSIRAPYLIVASGYPVINTPGWYFLRMEQHRAWRVRVSYPVRGCFSTADGSCTVRETENGSILYLFSETGEEEVRRSVDRLIPREENTLLSIRSAMECFTMDRLPFIGPYSRKTPNLFVASGYGGNGILGSMMAAQAISARVLGLPSEGYDIYSPFRKWKAEMSFSIGRKYLKSFLCRPSAPKCPHLGCRMIYHPEKRIWECPCHGSCFDDIGHVLNGPAVRDAFVKHK